MDENQFEDIIVKYPELIEEELRFKGRQKYLNQIDRNFIDIIFKDRRGYHLIIELKIGPLKSEHIDQIKKYEELYRSLYFENIRIMLVGNRISKSMMRLLDREKVEYREIKISELKLFLKKKEDNIFLRYFDESDQKKRKPRKKGTKVPRHERVGVLTGKHIWNSRGGTFQNSFCKLIIEAGDKGVSMEEAQYAPWNPRRHKFYETVGRLKQRGYIEEHNSRYYVTEMGLNNIYT